MPYFAVPNALWDASWKRSEVTEKPVGYTQVGQNWPSRLLFWSAKRHFFDAENLPENVDRAPTPGHTGIPLILPYETRSETRRRLE